MEEQGFLEALPLQYDSWTFQLSPPPCCALRADSLGVVVLVVLRLLSDFVGFPIASNTVYVLAREERFLIVWIHHGQVIY